MIKKQVSKELKQTCWNWLKQNNMGKHGGGSNGNTEQQLVGLIGEIIVKQMFRIEHEWKPGFDGGFDFEYKGKKIDVKTMKRTCDVKPNFVNNLFERQLNHDCDVYLFTSLNTKKNELTVCGWIYKSDVLENAKLILKGTELILNNKKFPLKMNTLEIHMDALNSIKTSW